MRTRNRECPMHSTNNSNVRTMDGENVVCLVPSGLRIVHDDPIEGSYLMLALGLSMTTPLRVHTSCLPWECPFLVPCPLDQWHSQHIS